MNCIEINGVLIVGFGLGCGGIDFEDVNVFIIFVVEVIKLLEVKIIEGFVGGIVNLRIIWFLEFIEMFGNICV